MASVALDLQPFRDILVLPSPISSLQYETMAPSFVAILMPLMPPLPPVA